MVKGLSHKEGDHLSHKQRDHPSQKERDLHLRLKEMEIQHREDLSAVKQENYVLQSKVLSKHTSTDMYTCCSCHSFSFSIQFADGQLTKPILDMLFFVKNIYF